MKAIVIEQYGGTEQLTEANLPRPELGENDVLIEVHAAAINPVDCTIRKGNFKSMIQYAFPLTLGWDVAGIISHTGTGVKHFKVGDEVFSRPDIARNGAYAEYIAVDEQYVARKQSNLTFEEAASIPLVGLTSWQSLIDSAGMRRGSKVLIHAGAGGVGSFAIQLAKSLGAEVAATASGKNVEFVKSLGADEVINYETEDFSKVLSGYDIVFDTMGGDIQDKSLDVLSKGGILVSIVKRPDEKLAEQKGVSVKHVFMQPNGAQLHQIGQLIEQGRIKAIVSEIFPLTEEGVRTAHRLIETRHAKGKIVLKVK